jgi:hypothetical protein
MTSYVTYNEMGVSDVMPVSTPVPDTHQDTVRALREAMAFAGMTQTVHTDPNECVVMNTNPTQ